MPKPIIHHLCSKRGKEEVCIKGSLSPYKAPEKTTEFLNDWMGHDAKKNPGYDVYFFRDGKYQRFTAPENTQSNTFRKFLAHWQRQETFLDGNPVQLDFAEHHDQDMDKLEAEYKARCHRPIIRLKSQKEIHAAVPLPQKIETPMENQQYCLALIEAGYGIKGIEAIVIWQMVRDELRAEMPTADLNQATLDYFKVLPDNLGLVIDICTPPPDKQLEDLLKKKE